MEIVAGALPSLLPKLAELLAGEYNLQKEVKGGIIFLRAELESMQGALEKISKTPADKVDDQDKIWAREVREMSYDIEDTIDMFMVRCNGREPVQQHGFKEAMDRILKWLTQPKIRHKIAKEIREIRSRVEEVAKRRDRYRINTDVVKPVTIDPRLFAQYQKVTELVGIDEARDEVIKILMEDNEVSKQEDKIVSIVGFGGMGKTTLANVVFEKFRAQFDCSAFVSVSQTPDLEILLKDMFYQVAKKSNENTNVNRELKEFLETKRYFIVIDDIWNISVWKMIKCALPANNIGSKIIATTRILNVAKEAGEVYELKPLSVENSRKLLYTRIFGKENQDNYEDTGKYDVEELSEVCDRILKKCAGVPLALITIGSLLAHKTLNKMDWYEVCNSISTGFENNCDVDNMKKILLLSYYDLPCHLKTCFLYLSVFPEDFKIEKERLIWLWAAEGFIQCKRQGESLLELGECYFNELINRSMIQHVKGSYYDDLEYCRVHDMVLELIRSLSSEENLITILNGDMDHISASNTIRRLSLQHCKVDPGKIVANVINNKIRSFAVVPGKYLTLDLGSFRVLRVLDLQGCTLSEDRSLKCLEKVIHLRYLGLRDLQLGPTAGIGRLFALGYNDYKGDGIGIFLDHLVEEVGKLRCLQTLDMRGNYIKKFPLAVFQLKHLRHLHIERCGAVPSGIKNLTSLEVLNLGWIEDSTTIAELRHLTELRVLDIDIGIGLADSSKKSLVELLEESLNKLNKIHSVRIGLTDIAGTLDAWRAPHAGTLDAWRAPPHLRRIKLERLWFSARPDWMNPSRLRYLSALNICMKELQLEDLQVLGSLPALRRLSLSVGHEEQGIVRRLVVGASSFPSLLYCDFWGFVPPVAFGEGAMARLAELWFTFPVRKTRETAGGSIGGLELGLGNLASLEVLHVLCDTGEDGEEARAVLRHAAEIHPNHPRLICV